MDTRDNYDNIVRFSESDIKSLIAEHHGVDSDDVQLYITPDGKICANVGVYEPEREISFSNHY